MTTYKSVIVMILFSSLLYANNSIEKKSLFISVDVAQFNITFLLSHIALNISIPIGKGTSVPKFPIQEFEKPSPSPTL